MRRVLIASLLAASLPTQTPVTTAYIQDTTTGPYGNIAPLGCLASGIAAESRSQILIPARYLPGPNSMLTGIAAVGNSSSATNTSIHYSLLRITISRTSATALNANFASNLPSPQVVLNTTSLTVNWQAGAWTPIVFTSGYIHDGTSSLVVEIQKVVSPAGDATMKTAQGAGRTDLPRMINALGGVGSNAHAAATATATNNFPLSMRLQWSGLFGASIPTLRLRSDAAGFANQFAIGSTFSRIVDGAPGGVHVDLAALAVLQTGRIAPPVLGVQWLDGVTLDLGVLPASGTATLSMSIPANPALVGLYIGFQSLVAPPPLVQWTYTNMADCFVRA